MAGARDRRSAPLGTATSSRGASDEKGVWTLRNLAPGIYALRLDPATLPEGVTAGHTVLPNFRVFGRFPQHTLFTLAGERREDCERPLDVRSARSTCS